MATGHSARAGGPPAGPAAREQQHAQPAWCRDIRMAVRGRRQTTSVVSAEQQTRLQRQRSQLSALRTHTRSLDKSLAELEAVARQISHANQRQRQRLSALDLIATGGAPALSKDCARRRALGCAGRLTALGAAHTRLALAKMEHERLAPDAALDLPLDVKMCILGELQRRRMLRTWMDLQHDGGREPFAQGVVHHLWTTTAAVAPLAPPAPQPPGAAGDGGGGAAPLVVEPRPGGIGFVLRWAPQPPAPPWQNPHLSGALTCRWSSIAHGCQVETLVARGSSSEQLPIRSYTQSIRGTQSWMAVDLGPARDFAVNRYALRNDAMADYTMRCWEFQGAHQMDGPWATLRRHEDDSSLEVSEHAICGCL